MRSARLLAISVVVATVLAGTLTASVATADTTAAGSVELRQSWDAAEPGLTSLTAQAVQQSWSTSLGSSASVPNQIYARPVVAGTSLVVATEDNTVAALNPADGTVRWRVSLGPGWTPTPTCGDLTPHVGVTSTPVYDASTGTVYVIAKADDGPDVLHPSIKVHALSVADGTERPGWPLTVAGRSTNGGRTFDAATSNQRPGLLIADGALYFATASHCDHGPFVGFVGRVPLPAAGAIPTLKLWTTQEDDPNGQAGIWQSGGGIMADRAADGSLRLFVASGNGLGVSPPPGPGNTPPGALAESVIALRVQADGSLAADDFFSPANNARLDEDDADLGSGSPVGLPASFGSTAHPRLLVIAGKDGVVRLLDRDDLGGVAQGPGGTDDVVSSLQTRGVWGHAAVFDGGTGARYLYLAPSSSPMQAITVSPDAAGNPTLNTVAASDDTFGFGSGSPVVTSDGNDPSTALVWIVHTDGPSGTNARLEAFPAVPPTGAPWTPVRSFLLGTVAKFIQPTTDGGRVFVGTRDGRVLAFGTSTTSPLTVTPTDFGLVATGSTAVRSISATARRTVTIDAVQASDGFTVDPRLAQQLPVEIHPGDPPVSGNISFSPTASGPVSGTLTLQASENGGPDVAYRFSLRGTGTSPGLTASPASLDFGKVAVGQSAQRGVTIQNTGATATVISGPASFGTPGGPFSVVSANPAAGLRIPAQGSVTLVVRFSPTEPEPANDPSTDQLTLRSSTGAATVPLTAVGYTGQPQLTLTESALDFGTVQPGGSAVQSFQIHNDGTATMSITKAPVPATPFVVPRPVAEGQLVEPGGSVYAQVFARPISAMPRTDVYSVSIGAAPGGAPPADGNSPQSVRLSVNTAAWVGAIRGPYGCVTAVSGGAVVDGPCTGTTGTAFARTSDGRYHLGGADGTQCLSTTRSSTARGATVVLASCSATAAGAGSQIWQAPPPGTLVNKASHLCLRPTGGSTASGARLVLDTCSTTPTEQWDISALLPTRGLLSSGLGALGSVCLGTRGNASSAGTAAVVSACSFATGQIVTHVSSTLKIDGQCLTVRVPKARSGVLLGQCTGATVQLWTADAAGHLYNAASKLCLEVPAGGATTGTAVAMASCVTATRQRWTLPDSVR